MKPLIINAHTRISELVKANPHVIDALADFNPHFKKLRNPILRKLLASRVSIADACIIGKCKLNDFLDIMASMGFEVGGKGESAEPAAHFNIDVSELIRGLRPVALDVRPILAKGGDPLKLIQATLKNLKVNECLKLINTFEPIPLMNLLYKKGYQSVTQRSDGEIVYTWFAKLEGQEEARGMNDNHKSLIAIEQFNRVLKRFREENVRTLDVRTLEMPLPMVTILQNLETLSAHEALFVYHKKVPVYLLPELHNRGFHYFISESNDGQINMLICKL